ncbi:MAG: rhamnose transport system permease protein [Streptomyces sp.]|jgi:ribose transport system permease protein/erythritol transport system permease protein|nr:rhamnose transport system permease protein [Streptomyces sp.]
MTVDEAFNAIDTEPAPPPKSRARRSAVMRWLLTDRIALLILLLVVLLVWFHLLSVGDYLLAPFSASYLAGYLAYFVPIFLLAVGEAFVIIGGRGGIDLSVGGTVSLVSIVFGYEYAFWHWPLWLAIVAAVAGGAVLGAVNGLLIGIMRIPALIATLATSYAYTALALTTHNSAPIATTRIQDLTSMTRSVSLPLIGGPLPTVPLQMLTVFLPTAVIAWFLLHRSTYGRRLYALGTNETAARFAAISVGRVRFTAYVLSGAIAGLVAVVTVAQFASATTDAGTSGAGMTLPAITVAVLGGVAISGGVGGVGGVALAALLVTWLNAGILLLFNNEQSSKLQLFALGGLLLLAALLNVFISRFARRIRS